MDRIWTAASYLLIVLAVAGVLAVAAIVGYARMAGSDSDAPRPAHHYQPGLDASDYGEPPSWEKQREADLIADALEDHKDGDY